MNTELQEIAFHLNDLNIEVLSILVEESEGWKKDRVPELVEQYEDVHRRLRLLVHDVGEVNLPGLEHAKIRGIIQDALLYELPLDRILYNDDTRWPVNFTTDELEPVAKDFLTWFSHYRYAENKLNGAFLVLNARSLPPDASIFVSEIVECFAFEQYTAVYALGRVALETTLRSVYLANGLGDPDSSTSTIVRERVEASGLNHNRRRSLWKPDNLYSKLSLDDFSPNLNQMIERLCFLDRYRTASVSVGSKTKMLDEEPLSDVLHRIRDRGNSLLHGNRTGDRASAREMMRDLFRALYTLYEVEPHRGSD